MTYNDLCAWFAKNDGFMEPQIEYGEWIICENEYGETIVLPYEYSDDAAIMEGLEVVEQKADGWAARLSAPGYMDCTEWALFDSEQDAIDELEQLYVED